MAARVYEPQGRTDDHLDLAATSRWLRDEVGRRPAPGSAGGEDDPAELLSQPEKLHRAYRRYLSRFCADAGEDKLYRAPDGAVRVAQRDCAPTVAALPGDQDPSAKEPDEREPQDRSPTDWKDCEATRAAKEAPVPWAEMTEGWSVVPELRRQLHPRGWSFFVPGLAIDVWRRPRNDSHSEPDVEYALVFRGTADAGGLMSNFRGLSAFTPLVWDQYRQAARATVDLVNQIYRLHMLSDAIFGRSTHTRIRITSVGHSLGGGLASFVFLRVPQITSVIAFDPSPINGSSNFSAFPISDDRRARGYMDRDSVMGRRAQPTDSHSSGSADNIFVLYERGDPLTALVSCRSGAVWGDEGGPQVRCDSLNLSSGNPLRQHSMPLFACKLYLASQGLPTREGD